MLRLSSANPPADRDTETDGVPAWAVGATLLVCLLPLAVTPVLPLVDYYAHIARYYVLAHINDSAHLETHYTAAWKLLPNLGLDLLGTWLMGLLPPLGVAKLLGAMVILAPFLGVLALSRALHGRITASALFLGAALAYSHILYWGFANFLLGLGIALGGLALWITLRNRPGWQLGLALPLALLLFFVHGLAFAFWGLLLGCVELMLAWEDRDLHPRALVRRMARLASLALLPTALFLNMSTSGAEGGLTPAFDNLRDHAEAGALWSRLAEEALSRIDVTLRVSEANLPWLDRALGLVLWGGLAAAYWTGALRLDRRLWLAAGLAALLIVVMPPSMFGVGYLNDRAPLILLALLAAGTTLVPGHWGQRLVLAGLAGFFVVRLSFVTVGWMQDGQVYRAFLNTLESTETGPVGLADYRDGTDTRATPVTRCKPLTFLMLFANDTAVHTFAFATQQPLELDGPLLSLRAGPRAPAAALEAVSAVVVCTRREDDPVQVPEGFTRAAATAPWVLLTRVSD